MLIWSTYYDYESGDSSIKHTQYNNAWKNHNGKDFQNYLASNTLGLWLAYHLLSFQWEVIYPKDNIATYLENKS